VLVKDQIAPADEAQEHFEAVLHSRCFERTNSLRGLLVYLWQNRNNEISEYAIAVDALGRNCDFDTKLDATVRVQIGRLRRLLKKYYESEGRNNGKRLVIPIGSHQISFVDAEPEAGLERVHDKSAELDLIHQTVLSMQSPAPDSVSRRQYLIPALMIAILITLIFCSALLLLPSLRPGARSAKALEKGPPLFWRFFFDNGKHTRIVLPAPLFFNWDAGKNSSLMVRDISVNQYEDEDTSSQLIAIEKRLGKPNPWQNYTVASDTFASLQLARFLDRYGIQTSFSSSADSPHEITDHENIIAFGTFSSLEAYHSDLERLSFKLGPHERYVIDRLQPMGSAGQFPQVHESGSRMVTPGIVALLPRGTSGTRILLVQGAETTALITYLTSDAGMREIMEAAEKSRNPFFQAVILSEVNDGNPIQSRLAAFRPFVTPAARNQKILLGLSSAPTR